MDAINDIKVLVAGKNWKKLTAFSVIILLLITVIVFFISFELCRNNYLKQLDDYLDEIPKIVDNTRNELDMRSRIFQEDEITRAKLGLKIFLENNGSTEEELLEEVRNSISAESVSLLDENRKLISTTGPVIPEKNFNDIIPTLEPDVPELLLYTTTSEDLEDTEEDDGKSFVLVSVPGNTKRSLLFEFSCEAILKIEEELKDWSNILGNMILKSDFAIAFAKTDDKIVGFPLDGLDLEKNSPLYEELSKVFQNSRSFRKTKDGNYNKLIRLQGKSYLASMMHYPQENADIILVFPLHIVERNGFFIAAAISAIIGWGMLLMRIYVYRCLCHDDVVNDLKTINRKQILRITWPGILVMILVTAIFSALLLVLEIKTTESYTAALKRETLQAEINLRNNQKKTIRSTFETFYQTHSQIIADYLMKNPDQKTSEGLSELNRISGTDYLMCFDKTGKEFASSNSYTGFIVGENMSDDFEPVLLGYPYVIVGPDEDPYSGKIEVGTAIMMTDAEGKPDGFLLAVYSAEELNSELKRKSYENTVNSFTVRNGYVAAAVNAEDGIFIAHTDPEMIGQKAVNYIVDYESGKNYEGFVDYKGKEMAISAIASDGKTLMFMVPDGLNYNENLGILPTILAAAILLSMVLVYYPNVCVLMARSINEAQKNLLNDAKKESDIKVFYDGYDVFLTLFTFIVLIATTNGWCTSFDYVLNGKWTKGFHMYSIWAALFIIVSLLCIGILFQFLLNIFEKRISQRAKTITRLIKSLVSYTVILFLIFTILDIFGVNTTAMLASAGILSLAIGMGAKSMAEDMLAGFFMMTEGTVHVGDHVSIGRDVTGVVTDMGIRTTEITDNDGNVVILNNSKVTGVRNMSRKLEQPESENGTKNE